jgi:hypothetical protein
VVPSPTAIPASLATLASPQLHTAFLSILPRIETHARVSCRGLRCPHSREEFRAEVVALCWQWFLRLVEKGKDPLQFPTTLAAYAARAVKSGRRLTGQERSKDALSPLAQRRHGFRVGPLPTSTRRPHDGFHGNFKGRQALDEALQDNTVSPVPEQVAFKIDFPAWLLTHPDRDRRLIDRLMLGERTLDVSRAFGLSPARIAQKRREFRDDWLAFCGLDCPAAV